MVNDFLINEETPLYEKFNIQWIKLNSTKNKLLVNHKAPFLAAIIDSLEIRDGKIPTINVTLKDKTGIIQGTVLHTLYEKYSDFFTVGSVLVLKQFGVVSIQNNHCITITPNNLLNIYHSKTDINKGCVKKITIQQCTIQEIWQKYRESLSSHEQKNNNCTNFIQNTESVSKKALKVITPPNKNLNYSVLAKTQQSFENNSTLQNTLKFNRSTTVNENNKFVFKKPASATTTSPEKLDVQDKSKNKHNSDCTEILFKTNNEAHSEILKTLFEGVDTSALFDDF